MKLSNIVWIAAAGVLCACAGTQSPSIPARPDAVAAPGVERDSAQNTIPYWQSSFDFGGLSYAYQIVGKSPFGAGGSTTIPVDIVPLTLVFSDGTALSSQQFMPVLQNSPLFTSASFGAVGETQFGDAVMRSEFWKYAQKKRNYHVLLAPPVIEPAQVVNIPAADGHATTANGVTSGYVAFDYFMNVVEANIITQLGIAPNALTIFPTYHTQLLESGNYCCYNGYHNALQLASATGTATFTTVWGPISAKHNITVLSHEVAEWLNDPFYTNRVPNWIQPGFTTCGGQYLEVGDPVTQYDFSVNRYRLQDIAEYSWFTRTKNPIGIAPASGKPGYDLMGKLKNPAKSCT